MDIKNIIIFLVVFLLILWLQHNDDKKFNKVDQRISLYDKIKIPLVSAIFVILIKEIDLNSCANYIHSVLIIKPVSDSGINSGSNILPSIGSMNHNNVLNDIYIGPPDF